MEKSLAISNYFIGESQRDGNELTPLKLIKLCYIAHGWHLGFFKRPLIDEMVYAWKYGPVVASVYHTFKDYKDNQIDSLYMVGGMYPQPSSSVMPFLRNIWKAYGNYNGLQLSTLTHKKGTPWDIVWNELGGKDNKGVIIPTELIQSYYSNLLNTQNVGTRDGVVTQ